MKKNIWIFNHYATNMYRDRAGRHFWFAENLIKRGYSPTIFCASTIHNSSDHIDTGGRMYTSDIINGVAFIFVKTPKYIGNGKKRIINMFSFYKNIFLVSKAYAKQYGKPKVILASSVHPLTLVAGIKIAKKFNIPCICEIRDLWPETLVAYGTLKRNSTLSKLLFKGEKWIYKRADKLIFTMEGGKDYVVSKKWNEENGGPVDMSKIYHINNGVDLKKFNYNSQINVLDDSDLNNIKKFKVIYTGSIRKVNNIMKIVKAAEYIDRVGRKNISFLIFGDGPEKEKLEQYCKSKNLQNIKFKGFIDKNKIPYILSKSNLNIMHFEQNGIKRYGASLNKLFEYFASGKPTISDCEFGYDLIKKYNCGVVIDNANEKQLAENILKVSELSKEDYTNYCNNAIKAAQDFDFQKLTRKLEELF